MRRYRRRNRKVARRDDIQQAMSELKTYLERATDFVDVMEQDYKKGKTEYAREDSSNFQTHLDTIAAVHKRLLREWQKQSRMASRRRFAYKDPCNSMSYRDYEGALEGLEECHGETIDERKVEKAFDYLQELFETSDDFEFPNAMEDAEYEYDLNYAEYEFLKWHYDNEM